MIVRFGRAPRRAGRRRSLKVQKVASHLSRQHPVEGFFAEAVEAFVRVARFRHVQAAVVAVQVDVLFEVGARDREAVARGPDNLVEGCHRLRHAAVFGERLLLFPLQPPEAERGQVVVFRPLKPPPARGETEAAGNRKRQREEDERQGLEGHGGLPVFGCWPAERR